jgi:hypothetical protein
MTRNSGPSRYAGSGWSGFQGLISSIPVSEKSSVFRVASVASAVRQMAAIWASAAPMGRPSVSLPQTMSAYREAQGSSKGRTRAPEVLAEQPAGRSRQFRLPAAGRHPGDSVEQFGGGNRASADFVG